MLVTWAGYAVSSWGYVLIRGWDICFREWVSPLHPYQWPSGGPPLIGNVNPGSVFPKCGGSQVTTAAAAQLDTATQAQGDVLGGT